MKPDLLKQALENHEEAAELTLWLFVSAALVRIVLITLNKYMGSLRWISFTIFLLAVISLVRTGSYGGDLVYKHAAGVQISTGLNFNDESSNLNLEQNKLDDD